MKWAKDMNRNLTEEDLDMANKHTRKCSTSLAIRKIQMKITIRSHLTPVRMNPVISLLGIYPKDTDAVKCQDTCTPMFLAAMSTIAKLWKEPRCPSTDEWIEKLWSLYTMGYSSAIRNDESPPFASTWMELEDIMLSEVSQPEKDKHYMVSFIWGI